MSTHNIIREVRKVLHGYPFFLELFILALKIVTSVLQPGDVSKTCWMSGEEYRP